MSTETALVNLTKKMKNGIRALLWLIRGTTYF